MINYSLGSIADDVEKAVREARDIYGNMVVSLTRQEEKIRNAISGYAAGSTSLSQAALLFDDIESMLNQFTIDAENVKVDFTDDVYNSSRVKYPRKNYVYWHNRIEEAVLPLKETLIAAAKRKDETEGTDTQEVEAKEAVGIPVDAPVTMDIPWVPIGLAVGAAVLALSM